MRAQTRAQDRANQSAVRLTVHRSNLHIYAQVIDAHAARKVLATRLDAGEGRARARCRTAAT